MRDPYECRYPTKSCKRYCTFRYKLSSFRLLLFGDVVGENEQSKVRKVVLSSVSVGHPAVPALCTILGTRELPMFLAFTCAFVFLL